MSTGEAARLPDHSHETRRVELRRLLWVGPLVIVASVVANVVFAALAVRLFGISAEFLPMTSEPIAVFTAVGVLGAVIVFALVARFSREPISLYRKIALGVLLISLVPDLLLLWAPPEMRADVPQVIALMLTHVVAAAVCVWLLERLSTAPAR